jgi:hypothetical protein
VDTRFRLMTCGFFLRLCCEPVPEGKKREAIDDFTKAIGKYLHSGRHDEPNTGGQRAGQFAVGQNDAVFVYNLTKLVLSQISRLTVLG